MKRYFSQPGTLFIMLFLQARKDLDFSFAGLKNSFRLAVSKAVDDDEEERRRNSSEIEGGKVRWLATHFVIGGWCMVAWFGGWQLVAVVGVR